MNKSKNRVWLDHPPKGRVQVYYNLHKKCLSIRYKGKVIEHAREVTLTDARFHVQPAGRARVLREKKKNVHAYVSGKLKESFWFTQVQTRTTLNIIWKSFRKIIQTLR